MVIRQGDVPTAYLKAAVKETIYVKQVKKFEKPGEENKVWLLKKALYGLRQAGREWNNEIDSYLKSYALKATTGEACLYYMQVDGGLLLVCLYVNDIPVAHPQEEPVLRLLAGLIVKYQVKALGSPSHFIDMRLDRSPADIAFTVNQLARHFAKPRKVAWDAAAYLLRYLYGTRDLKLQLHTGDKWEMRVANDADFANDKVDRKSVSEFVVFLAWSSHKQTVVAQSSTTVEFITANDALVQAEWMQLILEILRSAKTKVCITFHIDNQPTIKRIQRDGSSGAQKAIDIRFHALKDAWRQGVMALEYIPTTRNRADLLTKSLGATELNNKRGLCDLS
ncbi:hypothetical protein PR003_g27595 [Phytophthora rubi]|uniref:Reverse transcriptase Ty1/copia-type domain-containing protein n=1 Tax=Phytophthora rubi TaxID=129364 RepID=A0A6A4BZ52_9STRA|nr:hypothetical protein PR003_g27595 [Phytophthora rubi]